MFFPSFASFLGLAFWGVLGHYSLAPRLTHRACLLLWRLGAGVWSTSAPIAFKSHLCGLVQTPEDIGKGYGFFSGIFCRAGSGY